MDSKTRARCAARARIFKALGNTARLHMVEELAKGERCVYDLTTCVGMDVSTVSRHLAVLRTAGIVQHEKRGLQVFYTLRTPCVLFMCDCVETVLDDSAKEHASLLRPDR